MTASTGSPSRDVRAGDRVVRVFVSSTFRDFQEERDWLVKRVFPRLREVCEGRDVVWGEVDLRWGVTDEQRAEGRVLPICLEEIRRCRPYFIGLLGERYGWVPEAIEPALMEREPWLAEHRERSVTELEFVHGVLADPAMADHAFFYLRDPSAAAGKPEFVEGPSEEESASLGEAEAKRRAAERRERLAVLKERVRTSGLPVREGLRSPQELGELVYQDLLSVIDRLFPEGSQPHPLDREAVEHEAVARSRLVVYVGRQAYLEALDAHAMGEDPPLAVLGESGSGKSALLANWALRYREAHPEELVVLHFVGSSPASADWAAMLRRLVGELDRRFQLGLEIPSEPPALRFAFAKALDIAADRARLVLVIDALNQLEDRDGALDLVWLPAVIPANVRLVLSTLPGRALDNLVERGWPTLTVEPLEREERQRLIVEYLGQYRKTLPAVLVERIVDASHSENPLFLRALLDELRLHGEHETLPDAVEHYLQVETVDDLYEKILERWERDYDVDRPGLVKDTMSLIWAARHGLHQAELLEVLGSKDEPLPGAFWSPLFVGAKQSLVDRTGLLSFGHDYLRQAVRDRYLRDEDAERAAHLRLADHFDRASSSTRRVSELPWQLAKAHTWERLFPLLTNLEFFQIDWDGSWWAQLAEVRSYWIQLESHSTLRMVDGYRPVLEKPRKYHEGLVWAVETLLRESGATNEALRLHQRYLSRHFRGRRDKTNLAAALGNQALLLWNSGDLDGALRLLKKEERISEKMGDEVRAAGSRLHQGRILHLQGDPEAAMRLYLEVERIFRKHNEHRGLQAALGNQAKIAIDNGELDRAMQLYKEEEHVSLEIGYLDGVGRALAGQAALHTDMGRLDEGARLHREAELLFRQSGSNVDLSICLANHADIQLRLGNLESAIAMLEERQRLCRDLADLRGLAKSLGKQADLLHRLGDLDQAVGLLEHEQTVRQELGDKSGLAASLANQALILRDREDLNAALARLEEAQRLFREVGDQTSVARVLGDQGRILRARGDLEGAMALFEEGSRICQELGEKAGFAISLGNRADIITDRGEVEGALGLHEQAEQLWRELSQPSNLARSLAKRAMILKDKEGRSDDALSLLEDACLLASEHGPAPLEDAITRDLERLRSRLQ